VPGDCPEKASSIPPKTGSNNAEAEREGDASVVRRLVHGARQASLATLDATDQSPYVSLVNVAAMPGQPPLLLISRLARHTRNLMADSRASLLFHQSITASEDSDPLALARVTLIGKMVPVAGETAIKAAEKHYFTRHPAAREYAGFGDFGWWQLQTDEVHLVAGFGRIQTLPGNVLQS
jgi:putative heme iron utilization protein